MVVRPEGPETLIESRYQFIVHLTQRSMGQKDSSGLLHAKKEGEPKPTLQIASLDLLIFTS